MELLAVRVDENPAAPTLDTPDFLTEERADDKTHETTARETPRLMKKDQVIVLDDILTPLECEEFVLKALGQSGQSSWETILESSQNCMDGDRKCERILWDSHGFVAEFWRRIGPLLPALRRWHHDGDSWRFVRLNERMRYLRYGAGDYFESHCDCYYEAPTTGERSFVTVFLYLNDETTQGSLGSFQGGATTFGPESPGESIQVRPKAGRVLLFPQETLPHAGELVTQGTKYVMRTDLMYAREEPLPPV